MIIYGDYMVIWCYMELWLILFYGTTGWWWLNHLEKWWSLSMGRMTTQILWKIKHVWNHQPAIHKLLAVGICWSHNYGISENCFSFFGEHVVLVVETGTGCFPPLSTTKDCQPAHWNARVHWLESRNRIPTAIDILSILWRVWKWVIPNMAIRVYRENADRP